MGMIALEVKINGKLVTIAGRNDLCALNALIGAIGSLGNSINNQKVIEFNVSGVAKNEQSASGSKLNWLPHTELGLGDEITVKIVDTERVDMPIKEIKHEHAKVNNQQRWQVAKDIYHQHKQEFEPST